MKILRIKRDLWIKLARSQFRRRLRVFGEQAKVCNGCREILYCDGPISFQVCQTIEEMIENGVLGQKPRKSTFKKIRNKFMPISDDCLKAYRFYKDGETIKFRHR